MIIIHFMDISFQHHTLYQRALFPPLESKRPLPLLSLHSCMFSTIDEIFSSDDFDHLLSSYNFFKKKYSNSKCILLANLSSWSLVCRGFSAMLLNFTLEKCRVECGFCRALWGPLPLFWSLLLLFTEIMLSPVTAQCQYALACPLVQLWRLLLTPELPVGLAELLVWQLQKSYSFTLHN